MEHTHTETLPIAVMLEDGTTVIAYFMRNGRGTVLPKGATWTGQAHEWFREPTPANIESFLSGSLPDRPWVSYRKLSREDVPADRTYRNAWVDNGKEIVHDMPTARDIHRGHIRAARERAFVTLDGQYSSALGRKKPKDAESIEWARQMWRDAPQDPRIDDAETVEALKAIPLPE